jgi:hypothetical protein
MRISFAAALAAAFLVSGCGGGQTEPTEAEEALTNEFQPTAPSPGGEGPGGEGNAVNGAAASPGGEPGSVNMMNGAEPVGTAANSL